MINSDKKLQTFLEQIKNSSWIALDTEFVRVNTYYPKFCLLQIATPDIADCIDILSIKDITLFDFFYKKNLTWVVHSATQDIEVLFNLTGKMPNKLFDTQIAAFFLNFDKQVAYKKLVQAYCDVELHKLYTRYDWTTRPLPKKVIDYALDDVIYLAKIYPVIKKQLQQKGCLSWAKEDSSRLLDEKIYTNDVLDLGQRVKIPNKQITDIFFKNIIYLAIYRELKAQQQDKPRAWVIKDADLINIAYNLEQFKDKKQIFAIKTKYPELENIKQSTTKHRPLSNKEKLEKQNLQKFIETKASEYNLPVEIFLTNKQLNSIVKKIDDVVVNGWRTKILKEK